MCKLFGGAIFNAAFIYLLQMGGKTGSLNDRIGTHFVGLGLHPILCLVMQQAKQNGTNNLTLTSRSFLFDALSDYSGSGLIQV